MKRFNELKLEQQDQAVTYALTELKECIEQGIISFGKAPKDDILKEYALCAAQDAFYAEEGDKVIYDLTWK